MIKHCLGDKLFGSTPPYNERETLATHTFLGYRFCFTHVLMVNTFSFDSSLAAVRS